MTTQTEEQLPSPPQPAAAPQTTRGYHIIDVVNHVIYKQGANAGFRDLAKIATMKPLKRHAMALKAMERLSHGPKLIGRPYDPHRIQLVTAEEADKYAAEYTGTNYSFPAQRTRRTDAVKDLRAQEQAAFEQVMSLTKNIKKMQGELRKALETYQEAQAATIKQVEREVLT